MGKSKVETLPDKYKPAFIDKNGLTIPLFKVVNTTSLVLRYELGNDKMDVLEYISEVYIAAVSKHDFVTRCTDMTVLDWDKIRVSLGKSDFKDVSVNFVSVDLGQLINNYKDANSNSKTKNIFVKMFSELIDEGLVKGVKRTDGDNTEFEISVITGAVFIRGFEATKKLHKEMFPEQADYTWKAHLGEFRVAEENQLVSSHNVIRVGSDYHYRYATGLRVMKKTEVITDFTTEILADVERYRAFVNEPSHTDYRESIGVDYNLYKRLEHVPEKGEWKHIDMILSHIFKDEYKEMILTYLYVMYTKPKHPLPAIGLVGGQGTGKSGFLELVLNMFGANGKALDAEDILANFNESYIDKLAIVIDEKLEGKNRGSLMNRLKKLITGGSHNRKEKYASDNTVQHYGKYIMASNDSQSMLKLETENTRFWIIKVPPISGKKEIDIIPKAVAEIPAFFHYLIHEYIPLKRVDRLWFDPKLYQNDISKEMMKYALPNLAAELVYHLDEWFSNNEAVTEISFSSLQFIEAFGKGKQWTPKWFSKDIATVWGDDKVSEQKRIGNPFINTEYYGGGSEGFHSDKKNLKAYTFSRDEIAEFILK